MATTRKPAAFAELEREKAKECIRFFGRTDFTLYRFTETRNAMGRILTSDDSTPVATNVWGDLQFDTKLLKAYLDQGVAVTGSGIFFTLHDTDVQSNDELQAGSDTTIRWKLTEQVEGPQTDGNNIYQAWIVIRKQND